MKKITVTIALIASLITATACDGITGREEEIDKDVTTLYVENFTGGFGVEWLEKIEKRFESEYSTYYNEDNGKTGVNIEIVEGKTGGSALVSSVNKGMSDVFFTENVFYSDLVSSGAAMDITDLVKQSNSDNKTIESKLNEQQQNYYGTIGKDGKQHYYALPHYTSYSGLSYNVDVFNEYNLFLEGNPDKAYKATKNGDYYSFTNLDGILSYGPDGKHGTDDDGLPATFEEFFAVMTEIKEKSVVPFMWSGQWVGGYFGWYLEALSAAIDGLENTKLQYSFDGTATTIIDHFDDSENPVLKPPTTITNNNGYEAFHTEGRYYALKFFEHILSDSANWGTQANSGTHGHIDAQTDYLVSYYGGDSTKKPVAMMLEGSWWYNEAREFGVMDYLAGRGVKEKDINVRYMPWPKLSDEQVGDRQTLVSSMYSVGFIKSAIAKEKEDIAKKFLMYCYTDESLQEFTQTTSTMKALQYEITPAQYDAMSNYAKSIYDVHSAETTDIVYPFSQNPIYTSSASSLAGNTIFVTTKYANAYTAMKNDKMKAKTYYENMMELYTEKSWQKYSEYFNK